MSHRTPIRARQRHDLGARPLQGDGDQGSIAGARVRATAKPTLAVAGRPVGDPDEQVPASHRPRGLFQVLRDLGDELKRAPGLRVGTVAAKASGTARMHMGRGTQDTDWYAGPCPQKDSPAWHTQAMDGSEWALTERLTVDGNEIAWDRVGHGPPVVLVHGTPWSSWSWRHVVPRLTDAYTVYVFDLLGFGASEKREGQDVSLAAHASRLAELVAFWGLDSPAVVAHDIGGGITLRAHLLHELAVRAFVLFDVVAIGAWGSPFYRLVGEHRAVFEALPGAIHEGVVRAYVNTAQARPLSREVEDALIAPWLGPEGQGAFYRQIAQGDQRDTREIEPRYGEIIVPTLIAWGELDPWIPSECGRELADRIPHARLELLPDAGHLLQEEDPGRVAQLAREHLDRVLPAD